MLRDEARTPDHIPGWPNIPLCGMFGAAGDVMGGGAASQPAVSLLEDHFFPKWHAVLQHWLAHAPDYDEVTAWYLGWKASTACCGGLAAFSVLEWCACGKVAAVLSMAL